MTEAPVKKEAKRREEEEEERTRNIENKRNYLFTKGRNESRCR